MSNDVTTVEASEREGTCGHCCEESPSSNRAGALQYALRLEYLTVAWNLAEGVIAIAAAQAADSIALLAFGVDSFVECASATVMIWRLRAEYTGRLGSQSIEAAEKRAQKLVAISLFLLAAYVLFDAVSSFWEDKIPRFSAVGFTLTSVSLAVMLFLARAKRRAAAELQSRALQADAFQTTACWWLSLSAAVGVGANGLLGWWWADPAASLVIVGLVVKEGVEAWRGDNDCC